MERRNFLKGAAPLAVASAVSPIALTADISTPDRIAAMTKNLNPVIQKARDAAMAVLKPTEA